MPLDLGRNLCRHFAMGAALGALLATALFASDPDIFRLAQQGASPAFVATFVACCFIFYCAVGATLSGFLLIVTEVC